MFPLQGNQPDDKTYVDDVFSTYLYTGNGGTLAINNGIDLAGKGGLVWVKSRSTATSNHALFDSARGANNILSSNTTSANTSAGGNSFNSNGFDITNWLGFENANAATYASWTFRKQPKFFDVVTGTGPGVFSHNLGSVPGCIIFKRTNVVDQWWVAHNGLTGGITGNFQLALNTTAAESNSFSNFSPTSTTIDTTSFANSGNTWVAYLFAHNAGGFGLTGTDNVISCGSYTGNGSSTGPVVSLGYEPQWLLIKNATDGATNWTLIDNMRGLPVGSAAARLHPNLSDAEYNNITVASPLPTGFQITNTNSFCNTNGSTYIYIAIRRGPMKTPTSGTSVFNPKSGFVGSSNDITNSGLYPYIDAAWWKTRGASSSWTQASRMTGNGWLASNSTNAEATNTSIKFNLGQYAYGQDFGLFEQTGATDLDAQYYFRRAPGFFDEVCYTGTGAQLSLTHNLGVTPELMIVKRRDGVSGSNGWPVWTGTVNQIMWLNLNLSRQTFNNTFPVAPTSTVFTVGTNEDVDLSGATYVAYLFASCPGVSKVTNFTGTGALQTINCGFTSGARFALIKRTDAAGDWYIWDSARGISSANDPYLLLNSTAAEVTTTNWVDTTSTGFQVTAASGNNVNINGASYIVLAIA